MPSADNSKCPLSILVWTGLLKRTDGHLWAQLVFFCSDIWAKNENDVPEDPSLIWRIGGGWREHHLDHLVKEGQVVHQTCAWVSTISATINYNINFSNSQSSSCTSSPSTWCTSKGLTAAVSCRPSRSHLGSVSIRLPFPSWATAAHPSFDKCL